MFARSKLLAVMLNPQPLPPKELVLRWNPTLLVAVRGYGLH